MAELRTSLILDKIVLSFAEWAYSLPAALSAAFCGTSPHCGAFGKNEVLLAAPVARLGGRGTYGAT